MNLTKIKNPWNPDIQGLRGLSILMVVVFHIQPKYLPSWGLLGVSIFFVISGYVITGSIVQIFTKQSSELSLNLYLRIFYIKRVKRLLPISILVIFTTLSIAAFDNNSNHSQYFGSALFCFFYIGNLYGIGVQNYGLAPGLSHFWSLAIEEQFYLLYPFLIFYIQKINLSKKNVVSVFVTVILIIQISHPFLFLTGIDFGNMPTTYADLILAGCTWKLIENSVSLRNFKYLKTIRNLGIFILLFSCFPKSISKFDNSNQFYLNYVSIIAVLTFFLAFTTTIFNKRFLKFFGKISYSLYCIHWPVLVFTHKFIGNSLFISLLALALSISVATISSKYFESYFYESKDS